MKRNMPLAPDSCWGVDGFLDSLTEGVVQLPGKHKDLAWIPGTHIKESAYVMGACNLSAEEAEVGGAQGLPGPAV